MVIRRSGPVSYDVQVGDAVEHRHATQLRKRYVDMPDKSEEEEVTEEILREFENQQSKRTRLANPPEQKEQLYLPSKHEQHPVLPIQGPQMMGHPERPADNTPAEKPLDCHPASEREPIKTRYESTDPQALAGRRTLRDRTTIHSKHKFADEYSGLGSKKTT